METRGRDLWHRIVQSNLLSSRLTLLLFRKEYHFIRCGLRSTRQKIVKFYVDYLIIIIMGDRPRRPTKRPAFLNDYSLTEDEVKTKKSKSKKNHGPKSTSTTARSAGQAGAGASAEPAADGAGPSRPSNPDMIDEIMEIGSIIPGHKKKVGRGRKSGKLYFISKVQNQFYRHVSVTCHVDSCWWWWWSWPARKLGLAYRAIVEVILILVVQEQVASLKIGQWISFISDSRKYCAHGMIIMMGRYIQHCMHLQLAVDPYKKCALFESMDWLPKTHRVSWHIYANQISTKRSPTVASWYEEWGLQFSQKSDIWWKYWSPFYLFLDFRNGAFWQLD